MLTNDISIDESVMHHSYKKAEVGQTDGKLNKLLMPYDGFKGKKNFKFEQYNRLIELNRRGKKKFDPEIVILGKKHKKRN